MFASISKGVDIPQEDKMNIMHIISSHHDRAEWGAVKPPSTIEAMIVAKADMLDYEASVIKAEFKKTDENQTKIRVMGNKIIYNLHS